MHVLTMHLQEQRKCKRLLGEVGSQWLTAGFFCQKNARKNVRFSCGNLDAIQGIFEYI